MKSVTEYKELATRIRRHALAMTHAAQASHIGSCLSSADILAVLYGGILRIKPDNIGWKHRDRFILSKGHACAAHYAALAESGFFTHEWLETFGLNGGRLFSHASCFGVPGMEVSTGSLGHGLSIGCGMALAGKNDADAFRVFTLLSDGDCNEGSTWEAVMFAAHHGLDNLVAIVDRNNIQAFGNTIDVLNIDPLSEKWRIFGWAVSEIDGHDYKQIESLLSALPIEPYKPSCIIAHTVKGKGVSFMENQLAWHYKSVNDEQLVRALEELERN